MVSSVFSDVQRRLVTLTLAYLKNVVALLVAFFIARPLIVDLSWIRNIVAPNYRLENPPLTTELEQALQRAKEEPEKAKPAWDLARVRLELYFDRNLSQINYIFWLSVLVMVVGFCFILFGISQTFSLVASSANGPAITSDIMDKGLEDEEPITSVQEAVTLPTTNSIHHSSCSWRCCRNHHRVYRSHLLIIYRSTMQQASTYTKTLERINSVGMAMQIMDTISEDAKELQNKTKSEIVKMLLMENRGGTDFDMTEPDKK